MFYVTAKPVSSEKNVWLVSEEMPEGKAPHFPQQPVARQNDDGSLELECFLDASPQPDIKWFYDNVSSFFFFFSFFASALDLVSAYLFTAAGMFVVLKGVVRKEQTTL